MEQKELFNQAYRQRNQIFKPSSSLVGFYLERVKNYIKSLSDDPIKVLEVGSGLGSLFQDGTLIEQEKKRLSVTGVDFSFNAIIEAKKRWEEFQKKNKSNYKKIEIEFFMRNILDDLDFGELYDLVIDSHCFHCLNGLSEQKKAFDNMISNLKEGGVLAIETMVSHKNLSFSHPYYFDKKNKMLLKEDQWGALVNYRTIPEALEVENMILK